MLVSPFRSPPQLGTHVPQWQRVRELSLFGIAAAVVPPNNQSSAVANGGGGVSVTSLNKKHVFKREKKPEGILIFFTLADERTPETFCDSLFLLKCLMTVS